MKGKRRPEYLIFAMITAVVGLIATVTLVICLNSCASPFGSDLNDEGSGIVLRASDLSGNGEVAKNMINNKMFTVSDYVISVFESPEYLKGCSGDEVFASDLANVAVGTQDVTTVSEVIGYLNGNTRMYAVDKVIGGIRNSYKASVKVLNDSGKTTIGNIALADDFTSDKRILMGVSKTSGTMVFEGNNLRCDFLVDGSLCHGYVTFDDGSSGQGAKAFSISWDTSEAAPGSHEIDLVVRTDDGRGVVVPCGQVDLPDFDTISNDRVFEGTLKADSDSSWYRFNCENKDAYVNFAGLTGDIKVSLYDLFGNCIGTNDVEGAEYEVLRGKAQDVEEACRTSGIEGLSNCFYVRVQRGDNNKKPEEDINYLMIQSQEVAYYNGTYMAVVDRKDETVRLVDKDLELYENRDGDVKFLPLNGTLCDVSLINLTASKKIDLWPEFDSKTMDYAHYISEPGTLKITATKQEGYAADVKINVDGKSGKPDGDGEVFDLAMGINHITFDVTGFNGEQKTYNIYILCGDDESSFVSKTLSQFPKSYYSGLLLLHMQHPEYVFTPYNTGLDFNEVVSVEDSGGRSLATNRYNPSFVKPDSKIYDAPDWMAVKTEVVSYFLDPRNFLTIERVFMFERQSFNETYHTREGIQAMLKGTFMDTEEYDYVNAIYSAAQTSGVSPYLLASRILQEMGSNGASNLAHGTVKGYEGYYNYYNIGAYATTDEGGPVVKGAQYAKWGREPEKEEITEKEASYLLPWDSIDKAITGGALWIAAGYINNGQDTLYFQKFDVVDNGGSRYDHQYAGYIMMAYSEGYRYYKSYRDTDQLGNTFEFIIPVYDNMPDSFGEWPA